MAEMQYSQRNWGNCQGPLCRLHTMRCAANYCVECCNKTHAAWEHHLRPWVELGWAKAPMAVAVPDARLPISYAQVEVAPSPPAVPEPTELEETTDDACGDWTLAAERGYTSYTGYGG